MRFIKIFTAAALGLCAATVQAQDTAPNSMTTLYGYCSNPYATVSFQEELMVGGAMEFNAAAINLFQGCKITAIAVANGMAADGSTVTEIPMTLFVANSLTGEPTATYETTMDFTAPLQYKEYVLPEPIEITAETQPMFFGYKAMDKPGEYGVMVVDAYDLTQGPGDYLGCEVDGTFQWDHFGSQVGQTCIRVRVEGESFNNANKVALFGKNVPGYSKPGEDMEISLTLQNLGLNDVTSVTVNYTINNGETNSQVVELPAPLIYNEYMLEPVKFTVAAPMEEGVGLPIKIEVAGVNADGVQNNAGYVQRVFTGTFNCFAEGYDKNLVAEIGTGTWCGYCPRGILAVEKMMEYAEEGRFIPIAVHGGDEMETTSYRNFTNLISGYPSVVFNRDTKGYGVQSPSFEGIKAVYDKEMTIPALVKPQVTGYTYDEASKKITVEASAEFAFNLSGNYGFAYVILEDKVGPYVQTNYYSGAFGELEWWDRQGEYVEMEYDAVARYIYSFGGINGSIPATIEAGQTYTHSQAVPVNTVTNIANCSIVLMVINRSTGLIENAVMVPVEIESGIESVETEINNEPAMYYDIQGRAIATPREGQIYIERRGSETRKIRF